MARDIPQEQLLEMRERIQTVEEWVRLGSEGVPNEILDGIDMLLGIAAKELYARARALNGHLGMDCPMCQGSDGFRYRLLGSYAGCPHCGRNTRDESEE